MISDRILTLPQILSEMDVALDAEIEAQKSNKSVKHIAVEGKLLPEQNGYYLYVFSLNDPWEPEDETPVSIKVNSTPPIKATIVTSTGTTIIIATKDQLPQEALRQITLFNDSTQLLERLKEVLQNNDEGPSQLGSKTFGLLPFNNGKWPLPMNFGKFNPDDSQMQAIHIACGSEVTYIVGPPGTGKTSTLAAIAFTHLRRGRTVLIAAHTNIAVDNAIMQFADICKNAGASDELHDGRVVRYGANQHPSLGTDEYADIYLPAIVKRRTGDLHQQRETLQTNLQQAQTKLEVMIQEQTRSRERWQAEHQRLKVDLDTCLEELEHLRTSEQQRIAFLDAQLHQITNQLKQVQERLSAVKRALAQMVAQQVQRQTEKTNHLSQINSLTIQLAEAQQMSAVKRFFKHVSPNALAQLLADTQQQLWYDDQILFDLQKRMNGAHSAHATIDNQIKQLTASYHDVLNKRNTPTAESQRLGNLDAKITELKYQIAQGNARQQQESTETEQKRRVDKDDIERIREQIATIDTQLINMEKSIVTAARVVATTLSKTYMDSSLRERRFDVVILDEVSMAQLPAVYVAASRANNSVVAIGDPQQLAPICQAKEYPKLSEEEKQIAKKWLGTDLFAYRNITLEGSKEGYRNSALLRYQSRMHPAISNIARKYVYNGLINDISRGARVDHSQVAPLPGKPLILCDTSDASPVTTKPESSRINIYHALCTIAIARQALSSPPESKLYQDKVERIGIVTPYRKQFVLLQHLIEDAGLKDFVRVGTVHRFQGLEFDVVIFDTVESPPVPPRYEFTAGPQGTEAMRLVNVAVTRAKYKLIIVANARHIQNARNTQGQKLFQENSTLRLAIEEAQRAGVINSLDVLGLPLSTSSEILQHLPSNRSSNVLPQSLAERGLRELKLMNEKTFFIPFQADVHAAGKQIVIFSPYLAPSRTEQLEPILSERLQKRVPIIVITKPMRKDTANTYHANTERASKAEARLKSIGVQFRHRPEVHEKIVIIDERIVYWGSLNVLSHWDTSEFMVRVESTTFAKKVWQFMNLDTVVKEPMQWGPDIEVFFHELPTYTCKKCGRAWVAKSGRFGPFYGCKGYPECDQKPEDISENHLNRLQRLANISCGGCGGPTRVRTQHKKAWLECSAPTPCGYSRNIVITEST